MSDEQKPARPSGWHSGSAASAAARWGEKHPDEDNLDHPPPPHVPEDEEIVPNRHSASAEAAALRWHEQHEDD